MWKFDHKDLGAVLQSVWCLSGNIPIHGSKCVGIPCIPVHQSFLHVCGLLAACWRCWANCRLIVLPLMLRLAWEAAMSGAILEGSAQLLRQSVARELVCTFIGIVHGSRCAVVSSSWWLLAHRNLKETLREASMSSMPLLRSKSRRDSAMC